MVSSYTPWSTNCSARFPSETPHTWWPVCSAMHWFYRSWPCGEGGIQLPPHRWTPSSAFLSLPSTYLCQLDSLQAVCIGWAFSPVLYAWHSGLSRTRACYLNLPPSMCLRRQSLAYLSRDSPLPMVPKAVNIPLVPGPSLAARLSAGSSRTVKMINT